MDIRIIKNPIRREELAFVAKQQFGDLVKAVVDIEQGIMAIAGELHADEETILIEKEGSKREYAWGINFYPEIDGKDWIEFDSMINLKPTFENCSCGVDDTEKQEKIREIVKKLISE